MSDAEEDFDAMVAAAEAYEEAKEQDEADQFDEEEAEREAKRTRTEGNPPASAAGHSAVGSSASHVGPGQQCNAPAAADFASSQGSTFSSPPRVPHQPADDAVPTQDASLAAEQQRALDLALGGSNVFLTGGPGVGKSFTLRKIIADLEDKNGGGSVLVWAPTGVAAILVGGQTMQSKPGPGVAEHTDQFDNVWAHKKYWRSVKTLVLDEVSMADGEFLDWVEASVRSLIAYHGTDDNPHATGNQPFGGLQLIFCGDFCQLPPVPTSSVSLATQGLLSAWEQRSRNADGSDKAKSVLPVGTRECKGKWAFQTACWRDACFECVELKKSFRTNDDMLLSALHELRWGHASHPAVQRLIGATRRPLPARTDGIKPTTLYPTKRAVEQENRVELAKLDSSSEHTYRAVDSEEPDPTLDPDVRPNPDISPNEHKAFDQNCPAVAELNLRLGAQVRHLWTRLMPLVGPFTGLPVCVR